MSESTPAQPSDGEGPASVEWLSTTAELAERHPGPLLELTHDGVILLANAAAGSFLDSDDLRGLGWPDVCPAMTDELWQRVLAIEPGSDSRVVHEAENELGRCVQFSHVRSEAGDLVFVYGVDLTAQKTAERALHQSEKMATLGTLVAGIAHELNNPAAATWRAAEQLSEAFAAFDTAHQSLATLDTAPEAMTAIKELDQWARAAAGRPGGMNAIDRSDRESELEGWLEDHGIDEPWELAATLVAQGIEAGHLDQVAGDLDPATLTAVLSWATSAFRVHALAHEIGQGAGRISEIVSALKSYSHPGRAPVQAVDVHEGLDNTLVILRAKLNQGVEVVREYGDVPPVAAYGTELHQVWTNLLDNAVDAMDGAGRIVICTRRDGDHAVVEIVDDGPGIPRDVRDQVFEPFFTTKEPGKGTGLGLATTYSIVTEKHHGTIALDSRPGETRFVVRLPLASAGGAA